MIVLSIDPGLVNVGVCVFDTNKNKILFADKLHIASSLKEHKKSGETALVSRVNDTFFSKKSLIKEHLKDIEVCLIETQMKTLYKMISQVISAFCFSKKITVFHVSPRSVKRHFKTSSGLKTSSKAHGKNKKLAIKKAELLFPKFMSKIKNTKKKDDISDALLQAKYFAENRNKFTI